MTASRARNPLAAWRAGKRWPMLLIGAVLALLVAVLVCEAVGWPFLVAPMQRWLGQTLDRRVAFGDSGGGKAGTRVGLLGSVRVTAPALEIGAPAWSKEPHMLRAEDAALRLGYLDLFRAWRGQPLHVASLEAAALEGTLERRDDGTASWQFGKERRADPDRPSALPTFGRLVVDSGRIVLRDAMALAEVDARFALSDGSSRGADARSAAMASGAGVVSGVASGAGGRAGASAVAGPRAASAASPGGIFVRAGSAASAAVGPVRLPEGETGLALKATGQYKKLPLSIDLRTSGVLDLLVEGKEAQAQPLRLLAAIGRAELSFAGTTTDPLHFAGLRGRFTLAGASLAAAGEPLGITLPATPPFRTRGTIVKEQTLWNAVFDHAEIGSSRLNGAFTYDTRRAVPLLAGRLGGERLVLADLGPAVGAPPKGAGAPADTKGAGRVIPDKRFDLPSLRAMDANVLIDIGVFDPGTAVIETLRPLHAHLLLAGGVLTIADIRAGTAQGRLLGHLQLDGRNAQALWTADLRLIGVDLAQWLKIKRAPDAPPYLSGLLDGQVKVKGSGRSTAEILGSLGGDARVHLRDASISNLALEAAGIDIAQALGFLIRGDKALRIQCNVADLDIDKGLVKPKVFVLNTEDSTVWVDGTISLKSEEMDLRAVTSPKDFSPLTLRTPIRVRGTIGDPAVSIEPGKLVGKAGAAGLLALLHPLAALIPFIDPGAGKAAREADAQCAALVRTSGAISPAVGRPKTTRVPPAAPASAASAARR